MEIITTNLFGTNVTVFTIEDVSAIVCAGSDNVLVVGYHVLRMSDPVYLSEATDTVVLATEIEKNLNRLVEILQCKVQLSRAREYNLEFEVISTAFAYMRNGDSAEVAITNAINDWDL